MPVGKGYARKSKATRYAGGYLLVSLNQPKSSIFAGNSDTLKREPSESIGNKLTRANRCVLHHSRTGRQKQNP